MIKCTKNLKLMVWVEKDDLDSLLNNKKVYKVFMCLYERNGGSTLINRKELNDGRPMTYKEAHALKRETLEHYFD